LKRVVVVGVTGSIGRQALDVVRRHRDLFAVAAVSAHTAEAGLAAAAGEFGLPPRWVCLSGRTPTVDAVGRSGAAGLADMIREADADIVLNAAAGSDGLPCTMAALSSGKDVALANKESVVMAGRLVMDAARAVGRRVLPVDSEHSAIFNLVERIGREYVRGVIITASGGPFRELPLERLASVSVEDALAHPTWNMGRKITVDSASMANKGLEVIEASRLFGLAPADIEVVIHPESRVHSFVRTLDGSLYAQMSRPDMRLPILNALAWPDVVAEDLADLDPALAPVTFHPVDGRRYPMLGLAYAALASGEGAANAYNAANEVAVAAFLDSRIGFTAIPAVVESVLDRPWPARLDDLEAVASVDAAARSYAAEGLREMQ